MKRFRLSFVTLAVLIAFHTNVFLQAATSTGPRTGGQERSAPERVSADTPRVTPGGATFTVPKEWSIVTGKNMVILEPPETDTHVVIFDAPAGDAAAAVTAAWAVYKPESKRSLKLVTPRPAKEGWDERQVFDYETSPNERASVVALAFRSGTSWTVAILDGTDPTVEKRSAAVGLVFESLRPKSYKRESFAGRKSHPLDRERIATLTAFVESSMRQLGIPGVSIALIDQGKVVYQGGLGVRELGKPERVDENTVFMAASNTKGMTTLLLSELVDQKKLKWDQPVIEVYPSFKLGDADTTKKVLIRT
jgi:beta-lactamase family protein